jgi:hypothetical protein
MMPPVDMDSTAIAMNERVRIEDNVASAILNASSGSGLAASSGADLDEAQDAPSDSEVRFLDLSALAFGSLFASYHRHTVTYDGRNSSTSSPPRSRARQNKSEP